MYVVAHASNVHVVLAIVCRLYRTATDVGVPGGAALFAIRTIMRRCEVSSVQRDQWLREKPSRLSKLTKILYSDTYKLTVARI